MSLKMDSVDMKAELLPGGSRADNGSTAAAVANGGQMLQDGLAALLDAFAHLFPFWSSAGCGPNMKEEMVSCPWRPELGPGSTLGALVAKKT